MFISFHNPHIQTLYATFVKNLYVDPLIWERFELDDGDFVDCVWYSKIPVLNKQPIVVLFHGLTGSVNSPYIVRMMQKLVEADFLVVLMHFRGCSGTINRLPRSYHSGETGDAKAWFSHLKRKHPDQLLFAVGFSLGGNMLLKLMGESDTETLPDAAVAVSAPMDLAVCAHRIDQGFSRIYQHHLMQPLKKQLLQKYELFDMSALIGLQKDEISKLKNFREFDDAYTAPIHGFKNATDYYARSSARHYLKSISKPTLILHAKDDPFTGSDVIPHKAELSGSVTLELHEHGGHIGFVGGSFMKPEFWLYERIANYLTSLSKTPSLLR